jgi:hypothetical protein
MSTLLLTNKCAVKEEAIKMHGTLGVLGVSILSSSTQVRGFKPGRSRRIFQGEKFFSSRGSKAFGAMSQICGM